LPAKVVDVDQATAAHGISIGYADDLGGALGLSCGGPIRVLNGLSAASEFAVLAHEFAHELLHRSCDRPESRDTRELLEAEAVAFVVAQAVGLEAADPPVTHSAVSRRCNKRWQWIGFSEPRRLSCNQLSLATKRYRMRLELNIEGEGDALESTVDADHPRCPAGSPTRAVGSDTFSGQ
jgi:hypothetical protein